MEDTSKYPSSPSFSCALAKRADSRAGSLPPKCLAHPTGSDWFQFPPGLGDDVMST